MKVIRIVTILSILLGVLSFYGQAKSTALEPVNVTRLEIEIGVGFEKENPTEEQLIADVEVAILEQTTYVDLTYEREQEYIINVNDEYVRTAIAICEEANTVVADDSGINTNGGNASGSSTNNSDSNSGSNTTTNGSNGNRTNTNGSSNNNPSGGNASENLVNNPDGGLGSNNTSTGGSSNNNTGEGNSTTAASTPEPTSPPQRPVDILNVNTIVTAARNYGINNRGASWYSGMRNYNSFAPPVNAIQLANVTNDVMIAHLQQLMRGAIDDTSFFYVSCDVSDGNVICILWR